MIPPPAAPVPTERPGWSAVPRQLARLARERWLLLGAWVGAVVVIRFLSRWTIHPLSWGETAWTAAALLGVGMVFEIIRVILQQGPRGGWMEYLRLGGLVAVAGWLYYPFLTSQLIGGLDARWYGYVMIDALEQARAGVWPVFVGQGPYMYNGAIHPFLTAPYYTNLGIALDWLTGRVLSPLAIQHLVVLSTATLGAFNAYLTSALLLPDRRWLAWALAVLYVSGPAPLLFIYASEMYMTFCAFAWLPLVGYANLRLVRRNDQAGWWWLALGLALVWYCHAAVAAWATLVTGAVQGLRLLERDCDAASWRRALWGGLLFAGLTGFLFVSVSQSLVAWVPDRGNPRVYAAGLVLGGAALVRYLLTRRAAWLAGLAAAAGLLAWSRPQHAVLLGIVAALATVLTWAERARFCPPWRRRLPETLLVLLLAGGLAARVLWPDADARRESLHRQAADFARAQYPATFSPISADATRLGDLQPGYTALGFVALAAGAACFVRAWELRVFALGGLLLVALLAPVPGLTPMLYALVPDPVYRISSAGLWLRFLPSLAMLAHFLGTLVVGHWTGSQTRRWSVPLAWALVVAAVVWNSQESFKPIARGLRAVNATVDTSAFYRTETAPLYYAYDNLPKPRYVLNGVSDFYLESRILDGRTREWRHDPLETGGRWETQLVTVRPNAAEPRQAIFDWELGLAPGERALVRFGFLERPYLGYFDIGDGAFRRIYYLPAAGGAERSFGVDPARPKILSFWNTGPAPLRLAWSYMADKDPWNGAAAGDFARVGVLRYRPEQLQIRTTGLIPYAAEVTVEDAAYLETPRVQVPGYRATVNGRPVPVEASPDHLAMVRLEPGRNIVRLEFAGSAFLWAALAVSAASWLFVAGGNARAWLDLAAPGSTR